MFYNNEFGIIYGTYIRKRVEMKWCFDVINNRLCDSHMQYKRRLIYTT